MYNDRMLGLSLELLFECVGHRRLWFVNYFDGLCPSSVPFFVVEFELREQVVNSGVYGCRLITPFLFPSWETNASSVVRSFVKVDPDHSSIAGDC